MIIRRTMTSPMNPDPDKEAARTAASTNQDHPTNPKETANRLQSGGKSTARRLRRAGLSEWVPKRNGESSCYPTRRFRAAGASPKGNQRPAKSQQERLLITPPS